MARTLWPAGVTGFEAATAALGSVVIESSRDFSSDGCWIRTRHGHSPDRHGVGPCAAVRWLVQPRCGCSLRLAGGRRFETEMPISRHPDDLMDTLRLHQNAKNVNHYLRIFSDFSLSFL